jgi:hypothetical protein
MTAHAHNSPLVGYYKYTAKTPRELRAVDNMMLLVGGIRISSRRVREPLPDKTESATETLERLLRESAGEGPATIKVKGFAHQPIQIPIRQNPAPKPNPHARQSRKENKGMGA